MPLSSMFKVVGRDELLSGKPFAIQRLDRFGWRTRRIWRRKAARRHRGEVMIATPIRWRQQAGNSQGVA